MQSKRWECGARGYVSRHSDALLALVLRHCNRLDMSGSQTCIPCRCVCWCSGGECCTKSEDLVLMEPLVLRRDASVSRILSPIMTPYEGG